jgi:acetyl esterase/lipase
MSADSLPALPPGTVTLLDQPYVENPWQSADPDSAQTLDLYVPAGSGPFPLIVWIHGGGWHSLGKQSYRLNMVASFVPHGFAVASIAYRLTPDAPFPAQIEDCHRAVAWLKQHADEHAIDPTRIGVAGHSAGAHLCALLATGGIVTDAECVQAAVLWSPPCTIDREEWPRDTFPWNPDGKFSQTFFPSKAYEPELARLASPSTHLHPAVPPLLIVHGDADPIVPIGPTTRFAEQAGGLGINVTYRAEAGGTHDILNAANDQEAARFFIRVLKS